MIKEAETTGAVGAQVDQTALKAIDVLERTLGPEEDSRELAEKVVGRLVRNPDGKTLVFNIANHRGDVPPLK